MKVALTLMTATLLLAGCQSEANEGKTNTHANKEKVEVTGHGNASLVAVDYNHTVLMGDEGVGVSVGGQLFASEQSANRMNRLVTGSPKLGEKAVAEVEKESDKKEETEVAKAEQTADTDSKGDDTPVSSDKGKEANTTVASDGSVSKANPSPTKPVQSNQAQSGSTEQTTPTPAHPKQEAPKQNTQPAEQKPAPKPAPAPTPQPAPKPAPAPAPAPKPAEPVEEKYISTRPQASQAVLNAFKNDFTSRFFYANMFFPTIEQEYWHMQGDVVIQGEVGANEYLSTRTAVNYTFTIFTEYLTQKGYNWTGRTYDQNDYFRIFVKLQ